MKQFIFPNQTGFYRGKVRDVYTIADIFLVMVASDRISAFDVILPRTIPFKGQVLNQIAAYMLQKNQRYMSQLAVGNSYSQYLPRIKM